MSASGTMPRLSRIDRGRGPVVVLLHAFPLGARMWEGLIAALESDYRVIAPDLPGFGGSAPFAGPASIEAMADAVAALLDELEVRDRVVVGGLSMGGYAALAFGRRHAARLRGLILADTKAEPDDAAGQANRNQQIEFARGHSGAEFVTPMLPRLLGGSTRRDRPAIADAVVAIAHEQSSAAIVAALEALRDRPDASPGLARIAVPTLVLVGDEDALTPPATAQSLAERIPGARLEIVPGAGHLANLEQPESFQKAVRGFLDSLA